MVLGYCTSSRANPWTPCRHTYALYSLRRSTQPPGLTWVCCTRLTVNQWMHCTATSRPYRPAPMPVRIIRRQYASYNASMHYPTPECNIQCQDALPNASTLNTTIYINSPLHFTSAEGQSELTCTSCRCVCAIHPLKRAVPLFCLLLTRQTPIILNEWVEDLRNLIKILYI